MATNFPASSFVSHPPTQRRTPLGGHNYRSALGASSTPQPPLSNGGSFNSADHVPVSFFGGPQRSTTLESVPALYSALSQSLEHRIVSVKRKLMSTELELSGKSLVVQVGGSGRAEIEMEESSVHEQLVCNSSDFFKGALSHGFKESSDRIIPLSEFKPESFKIYLQWLYTGAIFTKQSDSTKEIASQETSRLFDAYLMGEYLGDTNFQDTIMDALLDKWLNEDKYAVSFLLPRVAQETSETSLLRRLLIDVVAEEGNEAWVEEMKGKWDADILMDLVTALLQVKAKVSGKKEGNASEPPPYKQGSCFYHVHCKLGKPCYRAVIAKS